MEKRQFIERMGLDYFEMVVSSKTKGLFFAYDKQTKTYIAYKNDKRQNKQRKFLTGHEARRWLSVGVCSHCGKLLLHGHTIKDDKRYCNTDCFVDQVKQEIDGVI